MGCCVSTNNTTTSSTLRRLHDPPKPKPKPLIPRDKPSESNTTIEEETVKEVLSETSKWNPTTFAKEKPQKPRQNKFSKEEQSKVVETKPLAIFIAEDTSEICSFSETMSTATSITDQREEREETRKRVERSQTKLQKNRHFPGERTVHGATKVGSAKVVQCRDQTAQKMGNGGTRRRRVPADQSLRRPRSPAAGPGTARPVVGRSPSVRKTNRCPTRVRTGAAENGCRKMENPARERKWGSAGESLENPLVSLECFIFI